NRTRVVDGYAKIIKRISAKRALNSLVHPLGHIFVEVFISSSREPHRTDRVPGDGNLRNFYHCLAAPFFGAFDDSPLRVTLMPLFKSARSDEASGANGWSLVVQSGQGNYRQACCCARIEQQVKLFAVDRNLNAREIQFAFTGSVLPVAKL